MATASEIIDAYNYFNKKWGRNWPVDAPLAIPSDKGLHDYQKRFGPNFYFWNDEDFTHANNLRQFLTDRFGDQQLRQWAQESSAGMGGGAPTANSLQDAIGLLGQQAQMEQQQKAFEDQLSVMRLFGQGYAGIPTGGGMTSEPGGSIDQAGSLQDVASRVPMLSDLPTRMEEINGIRDQIAQVAGDRTAAGDELRKNLNARIDSIINSMDDQFKSISQQMDELKPLERDALKFAQTIIQQTVEQQQQYVEIERNLMNRLIESGVQADDAVRIQQAALMQRGANLQQVVDQFRTISEASARGLMSTDQASQIGQRLGGEIDQLIADGKDIATEFAPRVRNLTQQMEAEIPGIRELAGQLPRSAAEIQDLGRQLGTFNQERFDIRFKPALSRIQQAMTDLDTQLVGRMQERGFLAGGSENEMYQRALLARERDAEISRAGLEAQAAAEGQQLGEYQARGQIEPAMYMQALQAGLTPYQALQQAQQATIEEQEGRLRIHAARQGDVAALAGQYQQGLAEAGMSQDIRSQGAEAATSAYQTRLAEMEQANQRYGSTMGTAIERLTVPQSERMGTQANVASTNLANRLGLQGTMAQVQQAGSAQRQQAILGGVGAGLGALGTIASLIPWSDENLKKNIEGMDDRDLEQMLNEVRTIQVKRWQYKWDSEDDEEHVGGMAQDMPDDVVIETPVGKAVDVVSYLGKLTGAVQALDKKVRGSGFHRVMEEVQNAR
jgi:hypothetical protein